MNKVREMGEQAEAAPSMTVAEAIREAQHIRAQREEYLVTPQKLKLINATLLSAIESSPCFLKAKQKGEEVFVLRQQDRAAPFAIASWADLADGHGCAHEKVTDARAIATRWRVQHDDQTKWPT